MAKLYGRGLVCALAVRDERDDFAKEQKGRGTRGLRISNKMGMTGQILIER